MRVLITGISGFVGSHLAELMLSRGVEIYGTIRWRSKTENIDHIKDKLKLVDCDINDAFSVEKAIREVMPDQIYHLAGQSFIPASLSAPSETLTTNIIGQVNIFEAIKNLKINPKIQIPGSSEEYGLVFDDELPIRETNPLRPMTPYGVSKVAQDLLGWQYFKAYKLNVVRTRAFNHTGPRRGEVFVESNFSKQIAMIEKGLQEPVIMVGNLDAKRDFSDVRDVVKGYWLALEKGEMGEIYNICSGEPRQIKEVLDILSGMTKVKIKVKQDPARMRPSDMPVFQGDNTKFRSKTGWMIEIPFEKTLRDLLNYWREKVSGGFRP
jgi:GDP-4-dehydro-6-deoxy-D-mannose reductase